MGSIRRALVALAVAGAATMVQAGPAQAGLLVDSAKSCQSGTSAPVFSRWLDPFPYVKAPGGDAESATGWTLKAGAGIVAGNEPWKVGTDAARNSLYLPAGSSATTGVMCVGIGYPTMRFFAKRNNGLLLNTLAVEVQFEGLGGLLKSLPIGVVPALGTSWQPTLPYPVVASLLPLLPGELTPVRFRFTPVGRSDWQLDDVYVDPWRFR
jgi:hypothetical protein